MARKAQSGEVNKSQEIRELLKANPEISAKEVVTTLADKGIKVTSGLVYFIKGKVRGRRGRRRKARQMMANVAATTGNGDVLATIKKVKTLAAEVGGLKKLKALVEVLSE